MWASFCDTCCCHCLIEIAEKGLEQTPAPGGKSPTNDKPLPHHNKPRTFQYQSFYPVPELSTPRMVWDVDARAKKLNGFVIDSRALTAGAYLIRCQQLYWVGHVMGKSWPQNVRKKGFFLPDGYFSSHHHSQCDLHKESVSLSKSLSSNADNTDSISLVCAGTRTSSSVSWCRWLMSCRRVSWKILMSRKLGWMWKVRGQYIYYSLLVKLKLAIELGQQLMHRFGVYPQSLVDLDLLAREIYADMPAEHLDLNDLIARFFHMSLPPSSPLCLTRSGLFPSNNCQGR